MREIFFNTRREISYLCAAMLYSPYNEKLRLNLSTMATLGTEESGRCGVVAVVESWF